MHKNGEMVAAFEREFAAYVGAKFAIALNSGTSTLHTALVALGVQPGDRVAVPPLTMSATTIAVLHSGAVPVFVDVDERAWLTKLLPVGFVAARMPVSLYGLCAPFAGDSLLIDDAAQTLRKHSGAAFTSYSFQNSKILALGEGGMLVTNDESLATRAREFSSLGYRMRADQPRIDPAILKSPTYERHHSLGWNYRMNDITAALGLARLKRADDLLRDRRECAAMYRDVIRDVSWLTPQFIPDGWQHDYWTYALSCDTPERALKLADAVVKHGGERPYGAWRLTYHEPAFKHLTAPQMGIVGGENTTVLDLCPVAESLQPRLLQFQTNDLASAERNAKALRAAIQELA